MPSPRPIRFFAIPTSGRATTVTNCQQARSIVSLTAPSVHATVATRVMARPSERGGSPATRDGGASSLPGATSKRPSSSPPKEAALAATTAVMLTDTRGNTIVLPAGTEPGQRICLPGARGGGRTRGDLFLTVHLAAQDLHEATEIHNAYRSSRCSSQRR
jgi:hypothetical protein